MARLRIFMCTCQIFGCKVGQRDLIATKLKLDKQIPPPPSVCNQCCSFHIFDSCQELLFRWFRSVWHVFITHIAHTYIYVYINIQTILSWCTHWYTSFNSLRPRQNGRHFADDVFKRIFLNGNVWISLKISLKFVPKVPINNILALVQIMAWRRPGDKPLSEPMMVNLLTHICVARPQWGNYYTPRTCQALVTSNMNQASYYVSPILCIK